MESQPRHQEGSVEEEVARAETGKVVVSSIDGPGRCCVPRVSYTSALLSTHHPRAHGAEGAYQPPRTEQAH